LLSGSPPATALATPASFSTYLGGTGDDQANAMAVDASGNVYVTGQTLSSVLPTTAGAFQSQLVGITNAFLVRFNGGGSLTYATYLGGGGEDGKGLAVDASGNAVLAGVTSSSKFPTTAGAQQASFGGGADDAFVTQLALSGAAGGGGGGGAGGGSGVGTTGFSLTGGTSASSTVVSAPLTTRQAATNFVAALDSMVLTAYAVLLRVQALQAFFAQAVASGAGGDPQLGSILLTLEQVTLAADEVLLSVDQVTLSVEQVFSSLEQNTLGLDQVTQSLELAALGSNQVTLGLDQVLPSLDQVTQSIDQVLRLP
jgi:hypothetical protein